MSAEPRPAARAAARCSVHPARRAADMCPACRRPRCGADAAAYGARACAACAMAPASAAASGWKEQCTRAGLAALAVAIVGGWIAAEYVDTQYFATLTPGLVGLACAWAASAAVAGARRVVPVAAAVVAALLATALSDRLVPGGQNLFLPPGHRLPPYAAAVIGALSWRVLFGPPRPAPRR